MSSPFFAREVERSKARDYFSSELVFRKVLEDAIATARGSVEKNFVNQVRSRVLRFGMGAHLTSAQASWLARLHKRAVEKQAGRPAQPEPQQ
jgi:hypothetical protein